MKKRIFTLSMLLFAMIGSVTVYAQDAQNCMFVHKKDGNIVGYAISSIGTVTIKDGNLCVNKVDGSTESYAINTLHQVNFKSANAGISALQEGGVKLNSTLVDNYVSIDGLAGVANISIYSLDGRVVKQTRQSASDIYVGDLAKGLYILNVDGKTFKFCKR